MKNLEQKNKRSVPSVSSDWGEGEKENQAISTTLVVQSFGGVLRRGLTETLGLGRAFCTVSDLPSFQCVAAVRKGFLSLVGAAGSNVNQRVASYVDTKVGFHFAGCVACETEEIDAMFEFLVSFSYFAVKSRCECLPAQICE